MTADESIYFVSIDAKGDKRLFCSRREADAYEKALPVSFSSGNTGDVDPEAAPDESFMIFRSDGRVAGNPKDHLFIAFRKAGTWGAPLPIRYAGDDANGYSSDDEPHLSPDLHTLYFSSDRSLRVHFSRTSMQAKADLQSVGSWDNGNNHAWYLPLAPLLEMSHP